MKYLMAIVVVLVIAIVVVIYGRQSWSRRAARKELGLHDREAWIKKWQEIEKLAEGEESYLKLAIIECDQLLDLVFKAMHVPGEDTGQRLKFVVVSKPNLGYIYEARRLRNRLVHEASFRMNPSDTRKAVNLYKRIFKDLGVL